MHESKLVSDLLAKAQDIASQNAPHRIETIRFDIGALSHVTPAALRSHFQILARDTLVESADIVATKSMDHTDPRALDVVLASVTIEGG